MTRDVSAAHLLLERAPELDAVLVRSTLPTVGEVLKTLEREECDKERLCKASDGRGVRGESHDAIPAANGYRDGEKFSITEVGRCSVTRA